MQYNFVVLVLNFKLFIRRSRANLTIINSINELKILSLIYIFNRLTKNIHKESDWGIQIICKRCHQTLQTRHKPARHTPTTCDSRVTVLTEQRSHHYTEASPRGHSKETRANLWHLSRRGKDRTDPPQSPRWKQTAAIHFTSVHVTAASTELSDWPLQFASSSKNKM